MIRVLVVDDSPIARGVLGEIISSDPQMEVIGYAPDGVAALKVIRSQQVDVVTLDIEMPRLDGLAVLEQIMAIKPTPVVMVAGTNESQAQRTLQALAMGATEFIEKHRGGSQGLAEYRDRVLLAVRSASQARVGLRKVLGRPDSRTDSAHKPAADLESRLNNSQVSLIAVAASTGGTEAVRTLLSQFAGEFGVFGPPIVIGIHMPAFFTTSYAARLNGLLPISVIEATPGLDLRAGHAYIVPGGQHSRVNLGRGGRYFFQIENSKATDIHRPNLNLLFESVANAAKDRARGFVLTGMGDDATEGSLALKRVGARVWGQSEDSCVVFGMPRSAHEANALESLLPIDSLGSPVITEINQARANIVG